MVHGAKKVAAKQLRQFLGINRIVFVRIFGNQLVSSRVANGDFIGMCY
jgi:hypothetical protein